MRGTQRRRARGTRTAARTGFTLVEVAVTAVLFVVAIGGLTSAVIAALGLSRTSSESGLANDGARLAAERLRTVEFEDIFATFTAAPDFDVRGLTPREGDPDGRVGRITFPTVDVPGVGLQLVETVVDASLGMPRDLNGDGRLENTDRARDYLILPVTIRLEWRGITGDRWLEYDTVLVR